MSIDYAELGKRIRARRKRFGLTQGELSERVGMSLSFLGHIERGTRKASVETLVRVANALETSPDFLLANELKYPTIHAVDPRVVASIKRALDALQGGVQALEK